MKNYMVDVELPEYLDEELVSLLSYQRMTVNRMMEKGVISTYAHSMDRFKLWISLSAQSERQVKEILQKMPLYKYMSVRVHELAFSEAPHVPMPQPSMN